MSNHEPLLILDEEEAVTTRFVSFKGDFYRYDLAIMSSERFNTDKLVLNLNDNKYIRLNKESLNERGFLEHTLQLTDIVADDLRSFLKDIL